MAKAGGQNAPDGEGRKPGEQTGLKAGSKEERDLTNSQMCIMGCDRRSVIKLLPFVLSDGGVYKGREIYFTSTDEALVEHFRAVAHEAFGYKGYVVKRSNGAYVVRIKGRGYVECLADVVPEVVCKPRCAVKLPQELYRHADVAKWFIKVYASCDGGISVMLGRRGKYRFLVRRVFITAKDPDIRSQIAELWRTLGYRPHDDRDKHIYISSKEDLVKYAQEIRFLDGVKVTRNSKRFGGIEKNTLLDLVVKSYEDLHALDPFFPATL